MKDREPLPSLDHLPLIVAFSAAYLDGVMKHEHPEIAGKWKSVREFLEALKSRSLPDTEGKK